MSQDTTDNGTLFFVQMFKERVLRWLAVIGFDLAILFVMAIVLIASALAMGGHIRLMQASVGLPMACMALALAMKAWRDRQVWREDVRQILRDWVPFLFVVLIYENMHDVAGQVMDFDFASVLNRMDIAIFGIEPTIWAQKLYSPLATDLFSISYALYFFFPLSIMFLLTLWGRRNDFRHMALCVTLSFIMGFLGYVFLPASPPRYFIENLYTDPVKLHGLFLFDRLQGAWDSLSVISGGAFPSLHVGISTVALIYAYKFRNDNKFCRIIWFVFVPLVAGLWFSTVYLRHHWVIDIFAGWVVAGVGYVCADWMMKVWGNLRRQYGP